MDLQTEATLIAGVVAPFITQLAKLHLFKVTGKAAQVLSLVIAAGCVAAADFVTQQPLNLHAFVPAAGLVWAIGQVVYVQIAGTPLAKVITPGK